MKSWYLIVAALCLPTFSGLVAQGHAPGDSVRGFPVLLKSDTLFVLYVRTGSLTVRERAEVVSERITKLYRNYSFAPDSLQVVATERGYDIVYQRDFEIMSVTPLDSLRSNTTADSLAISWRARIAAQISKERKEKSLQNWLRRIGLLTLILFGLISVIYGINKLFRQSGRFIRSHQGKHLKGLTIGGVKILSSGKMEQFALALTKIFRTTGIILSVYLALVLSSSLFVMTEKWTDTLLGWILTPATSALHGIATFLPNLFTILVIYFIFHYAIRGLGYFADELGRGSIELKGFHPDWARPTYNIIRFLLYAFMAILIFPYLPGSDSLAFKGVSVFLGVLISLGSSSAITNIVAGLVITYMRPFKLGDRVKIGDVTGDVVEKNMLVTRIRTIKNEDITVPNATVLSNRTVNYSANTSPDSGGLILHTTVTIGYSVPWRDMNKALIEAAARTKFILKDPAPFVLQTNLGDYFVSYQLNAYTREANNQDSIYSELHENIQDSCNEAGIEILSPHYHAVRDGNSTSIPADYLPKDYSAPPFVVRERE